MVIIRELLHRVVLVNCGNWEQDTIGKWKLMLDPNERQRKMRLRERDGLHIIEGLLREEYNVTDPLIRLKMTSQWPSWMLVVDDGTTKPKLIKNDRNMDLFLAMRLDVDDL